VRRNGGVVPKKIGRSWYGWGIKFTLGVRRLNKGVGMGAGVCRWEVEVGVAGWGWEEGWGGGQKMYTFWGQVKRVDGVLAGWG